MNILGILRQERERERERERDISIDKEKVGGAFILWYQSKMMKENTQTHYLPSYGVCLPCTVCPGRIRLQEGGFR